MLPSLRKLRPYIERHRRAYGAGLLAAFASTALSLVSPWVLKVAIDDLTAGVTARKLMAYGATVLVLALAGAGLRYWMRLIVIGASRHVEYDLRNDFFRGLQRLPASFYNRSRTGDLMSRATSDLSAVRMMVGPAVMYAASTVLLFVTAVALMCSLNFRLAMVALVTLPLVSLSVKVFGSAIHDRSERIQAQLADLSAVAHEALVGVRVVRAYGQESFEIERFRAANAEYVACNRALIRLQGMFYPSLTFLLGLGGLLVLWLGSREVVAGRLTLGAFVAFNSYVTMLAWPMIAFGWVTNLLQRGVASWERLLAVMNEEPQHAGGQGVPGPVRGAIDFRGLTFAYDGRAVLHDINLRVEPGQTVAIVGPTGSGKSTLVNLLPRLVEPPPGTVFIDGHDVCRLPLSSVREAIGMVPQEPFLFSDTVAGNVAFGLLRDEGDEATKEVVRAAAHVARLDKDVHDFPHGYETVVGERGLTLSGGQKQRTALARALVLDPPILILDDALSAVDTYTEDEILAGLRAVMRQRTSLMVSHRVSTVRDADLIVVLVDGRIADRGRHSELITRGGFYADLYRKQLLEEELAAS